MEFLQKKRHTLRLEPDKAQLQPVLQLAAEAYAVTLRADKLRAQFPSLTDEQAKEVVALARRVQMHRCTATCAEGRMDGELCSHFFPRVPSLYDHLQLSGPWGTVSEKRWTLEVQEFVQQQGEKCPARSTSPGATRTRTRWPSRSALCPLSALDLSLCCRLSEMRLPTLPSTEPTKTWPKWTRSG